MDVKISVIMPVYNAEKYLDEAIQSILNQTYENFEFIIINDGSIDKSLEIIKYYAKKDTRIVLISRENRGLPYSLNEGIKIAKGEYIVRMDADDIALKDRLKNQYDFMEKNKDIGISGGAIIVFGDNIKTKINYFPNTDEYIKATLLFSTPFAHPTVIFRKNFILKYNLFYNENYKHSQDIDLWNRMSKFTKMGNIKIPLVKYRIHKNSITSNTDFNLVKERFQILKNIFSQNLKLLGIKNSEEENLLHFNLTVNHRIKNIKDKNKLLDYFDKIMEANKKTKIYDDIGLKKVLGKKWLWYMYYNNYFSGVFKKYFYYGLLGLK